ncbi:MAG: hypothetical protein GOMPHAMPRED_005174 [Gomphillus americanus]|uniref:N-acetyltransferase domain-containing protein n=1 Tax=Gomphillus americanus TaxID=1940652 RepID=A0A8H3FQ48_9LECA|nr:MAG: hypothetical protein GOMPHAMPRED_005174 [Gomphillus americanus]
MLENSFCLGLYVLDGNHAGVNAEPVIDLNQRHSLQDAPPGRQIGLARLITDHVTFAWLTDVYVLPAYQRRGLGRWMVGALDHILSGMPELRRAMLISRAGRTSDEYQRIMGCETWENGFSICMQKRGPAGGNLGTKINATNEQDLVQ